ncbi:MAG: patatin-like phospholipase family protein [Alphaproteobacteria bacterium]|nr:patatin-like phospholipase family protein [Alphaproteobacteria bacterium]MBF0392767.1 patatin-like phospholipase family protein [Alphaproteobacteria bacterium]
MKLGDSALVGGAPAGDVNPWSGLLLLTGGSALGAFQAGACAALLRDGLLPSCIAGTSIGAVHAVLIAGNRGAERVSAIERFWEIVRMRAPSGGWHTRWTSLSSGAVARMTGVPGMARPRMPPDTGLLDLSPLRQTLDALVDFRLVNDGPVRVVINAVDAVSGDEVVFDTASERIGPAHVLASSALPPEFAPVEVEGRSYWDGSLACNIPQPEDLDPAIHAAVLIDLFGLEGPPPRDLDRALSRRMDLVYAHQVLLRRPELLRRLGEGGRLLHLAYGSRPQDSAQKTFDYGAHTIGRRWRAGEALARQAPRDPQPGITELRAEWGG